MNTSETDWTGANQRLLVAELRELKHRLEGDGNVPPQVRGELQGAAQSMPGPAAIDIITELFGLSKFERAVLLLCAGVELDGQLASQCARSQKPGAPHPTFGLALAHLPDAHWSALTPGRALRRWRLIEVEPGVRLVDSALRIDERILHFLTGINLVDARLQPTLTLRNPPVLMSPTHERLAEHLTAELSRPSDRAALLKLDGNDLAGQQDVAASAAARLGISLFVLSGEDLPSVAGELDQLQILWEREARLLPALLLVAAGEGTPARSLAVFAERAAAPLVVASRDPVRLRRPALTHTVNKPDAREQKQLWLRALGANAARVNGALDTLSAQFGGVSSKLIRPFLEMADAQKTI